MSWQEIIMVAISSGGLCTVITALIDWKRYGKREKNEAALLEEQLHSQVISYYKSIIEQHQQATERRDKEHDEDIEKKNREIERLTDLTNNFYSKWVQALVAVDKAKTCDYSDNCPAIKEMNKQLRMAQQTEKITVDGNE